MCFLFYSIPPQASLLSLIGGAIAVVWPLLMLPCALAAFRRRRERLLIDNEIALSERHFDLTSSLSSSSSSSSSSLCSRLTWSLTYYTFGCGAIGDEAGAHGVCCSLQHCCLCIECPAAGGADDDLENAHIGLGCTVCAASGARACASQQCVDPQCCSTFPGDCAAVFARFVQRCTAARVRRECAEACAAACVPVVTRAEREAERSAEQARDNARRQAEEVAAAAVAAQRDKQRRADREKRDAAKSVKAAVAAPKAAPSPQSSSSSAPSSSSKRSSITSASSSGSSGSRNKR